MTAVQQFAPRGPLALDRRAFGGTFSVGAAAENRVVDGVVLVSVRGPLTARRGGGFDSYDAILDRLDAALAAKPRAVVLVLDSPGGYAQGCFEAAQSMRSRCQAAGVPLLAFVDGSACSAAYALACAAERIAVTATSVVGSIGVYEMLVDQSRADAAMGMAFHVVSTGERKKDGNPHVPISDGAVAAAEVAAEYLGGLFFSLVETMRGVPAAQVRALDGALAIGRDAISKQLADVEVSDLAQLLASVSAQSAPPDTTTTDEPKVKTMDEIIKALQAVIDNADSSDDAKEKAKAALAALSAKSESTPSKDDEEEDETGAAAKALAEVHRLRAEMTRREEENERKTLLASRADFAPELVKVLQTAPLAMVRDMVATLPRTVPSLAAAASVQPTLGEGQGSAQASQLAPSAKAQLDARMNMNPLAHGVINVGAEQRFGAVVPTKA